MKLPDLLSHALLAFVLAGVLGKRVSLVILGALLPDLVSKVYVIARFFVDQKFLEAFVYPSHTPAAGLLLSFGIAPFFTGKRLENFAAISIGVASHFALDLLQGPIKYKLLWPLSDAGFTLNVFYPDDPVLLYATIILAAGYVILKRCKRF